jgi:hypothetical protein
LSNPFKLLFVNILLLSLFVVGYFFHYVSQIYVNDLSKITYLISGLLFLNIVLAIWNSFYKFNQRTIYDTKVDKYLAFVGSKFPYIGICGTIIGLAALIQILNTVSGGTASEQIGSLLTAIKAGMLTLFYPTLVGVVAYLWTSVLIFLDEGKDI